MVLTNGQLPLYASGGNQQNHGGPTASGDFTNIATNNAADGVYTLNGAPCAIDDIIDMASPFTAFDPVQDIDAGGIKVRVVEASTFGRTMALKDPVLASMVSNGFTIVCEIFCSAHTSTDITTSNDGETEYANQFAVFNQGTAQDLIALADLTQVEGASDTTAGFVQDAVNKVAFTVTDVAISASVNGGAVLVLAFPGISLNTVNAYLGMGGDANARLRAFAIYEPVDDADLPTLSAL